MNSYVAVKLFLTKSWEFWKIGNNEGTKKGTLCIVKHNVPLRVSHTWRFYDITS
jgi:hypothetical protein